MIASRLVYAAVASLAFVGAVHAQRVQPEQAQKVRDRLLAGPSLVSAEGLEKLKLTADQKEKFGKIEADFKEKAKSAQTELMATIKDTGRDREKLKEAYDKLQTATKKSREESLTKVAAILTAEQKTVLTQVQQEPATRRPDIGVRPIQPISGAGQIIPAGIQTRLQLTDDQKKQIEAIQKDAETKALKVLTEEQRKQYEEFKKNPARPGVRPGQTNPAIQRRPNTPANPDVKKD